MTKSQQPLSGLGGKNIVGVKIKENAIYLISITIFIIFAVFLQDKGFQRIL